MSKNSQRQLHVLISGRVQGVAFRYFVLQAASSRELGGWVRNLFDGRVEALVEGSEEDLKFLLNKMKLGSSAAHVEKVEERWGVGSGDFETFRVRSTVTRGRYD